MDYTSLSILIEGNDDERFFDNIVKPLVQDRYIRLKFWQHSKKLYKKRAAYINSIKAMNGDYIYVCDNDTAPCITAKKEEICKLKGMDRDKIIVVVKEIESWYLAGLNDKALKKLGIAKNLRKKIKTTNNITKDDFNRMIPKNMPRIEFMRKILEKYNVDVAKEKNISFGYFLDKWICCAME